ncbi:DEAD/DEAH box helicase family protein [Streptomyces sp. bgisy034]|uniref:DEAD/DEAH box helicase family protein n=1 Tax=Streptomyces sp. bgisy034 TaxID=3413774 RepID=UPI003EBAE5BC
MRLRPHQQAALDELERRWRTGCGRAWVVLPPGTGKTVTGLEAARRLGRPVVVFGPNTAIQGQWIREWGRFPESAKAPAGTDRTLTARVTVLTYQCLATFDPDAEVSEDGANRRSQLARLRAGSQELVEALRGLGAFTLLLDESHHLLDTWGKLLAELLRELPAATVIGLTGTPPGRLTTDEAALVDELFGPAVCGPSIPAVVREGHLAPYAEHLWLTTPTTDESAWLSAEVERFTELTTDLLEPGFATSSFLSWLDERIVARRWAGSHKEAVPWHTFERDHPELAAAALRFHHQGLLALPEGARLREEHRHQPTAADWVCLLDDYVMRCLQPSAAVRDAAALESIRAALPGVGYQLTARGIRGGRSPVDRVLARSAAKTWAVREILTAEWGMVGNRLRAVVLCDHERASATLPARLTGVLVAQAGSARLLLAELLADGRTAKLEPMLVTGRTIAAGEETARSFVEFCGDSSLRLDRLGPDCVEITAATGWDSRRWVPLATRFFEEGGSRVLIGTRAMLGEGWDTRSVNTLVDLTEATTATAVVQTRGRALRTDPDWPEKVAHIWSVVCVDHDHPKGDVDWDRFVRKHEGYFGITDRGLLVDGVAHVHPALSPSAPPPERDFDRFNTLMLARANDRDRVRELWRVGKPYADRLVHKIRVAPTTARRLPVDRSPFQATDHRVVTLPAERGVTPLRYPDDAPAENSSIELAVPIGLAMGFAVALTVFFLAGHMLPALLAMVAIGAPVFWKTRIWVYSAAWNGLRADTGAELLAEASSTTELPALAYALADGLHAAGLVPRGADAVTVEPDQTGAYRIHLQGVPASASRCFVTALDELISPIATPRYLIPRYVVTTQGHEAGLKLYSPAPPPNAVVYHAIPTVLGENRKRVGAFATAWSRWVSPATPVCTRSPEGAGILAAQSGASPLDATTMMQGVWE